MGKRQSRLRPPSTKRHQGPDNGYSRYQSTYIALFDYEARSTSDISFKKGDKMEVSLPVADTRDWLMVTHLKTKKRGLVPTSFVAPKGSMRAQE